MQRWADLGQNHVFKKSNSSLVFSWEMRALYDQSSFKYVTTVEDRPAGDRGWELTHVSVWP